MSFVKASLLALVLLAPAQAGGVDDLAELFAEDTMVFAELTGVGRIAQDWKEHAGAYLPAAKKKELLDQMEKGAKEEIEKIPELLRKDLEKLLPTLQRAAVGLRMGPDGPEWAVALASSDPALFKKIVDDDLKVFGADEKIHGGVTVRLIRKMGDLQLLPEGVWFAAAGRRMIATSQWSVMTALLDRAANRAAGTDLRVNPNYRAFAATPGADPAVRAFSGFGSMMDAMSGFGMGRRMAAHEMDKINAFLGLDKIGGFLVEASLKPGKVSSVARLRIASGCPLYDAWRQPAGPKELLKYMPADAAVTAHVNAKSGKSVWADIAKLMDRYEQIEAVGAPPPGQPGRPPRKMREQMERGFERELGLKPEDLFGAIGDEAAFGLVGPDAFAFDLRMAHALLFVVKAADPATAKETLKKIVARLGAYETKEVDGATFHLPPGEKADLPRFALKDGVCLIGGSKESIDAGLAAAKSGKHFAAGLPPEAAKASKILAADLGAFWKAMAPKLGPALPEEAKALEFDARSLVLFEEKENEVLLRSSDGTGLAVQTAVVAMPLSLIVMRGSMRMAMMGGMEDVAPVEVDVAIDAPPLPADEVAARVKAWVEDLQADDVVKREEAAGKLRALGKQAVPPVVAAYKSAADAETRGRLLSLLMDWKAYDAMPEVLAKKIDAFLQGFRRAPNPNDQRAMMMMNMGVQWYRHEGMPWTYCMEPSWVNEAGLKATPHVDVLRFAPGARAAAEAAVAENVPVEPRRRLASILAYVDCGKAGESLIAARDAARDPEIKSYLQIALGWSSDPKCRAAVRDGLKDADVWTRRSSFIAAERSKDPAAVGALMELLNHADTETRWNAGYTLKSLTHKKVALNIYAPKAELDAAREAAAAWWGKNKDTFKPGP
ncbi:MAG TPA: HEAT repeat domain-containing protein [Planctomycetota bacterium]